jgi:hypothetical protein
VITEQPTFSGKLIQHFLPSHTVYWNTEDYMRFICDCSVVNKFTTRFCVVVVVVVLSSMLYTKF